jgi:23S rRNA pseudouridine2605 synthase
MRLNRYISICGLASRRKAEALIAAGRVTVGGVTEESVGRVINGDEEILVDGLPARIARPTYLVMNKPAGVLSAASDARRRTVMDLLPDRYRQIGLFPVGRLDLDSEGLIILTNDGKFAQGIIHPSSCVKKTYIVLLKRVLERKQMMEWASGVIIEGKVVAPLEISPEEDSCGGRMFRIVLGEGFKREIKMMASAVGNGVLRLKRVGIGGLFLKKLPPRMFCEYNCSDLWNMISNGGEV